jgi:uncharacterized membrane protein YjgN (DUF898 family)
METLDQLSDNPQPRTHLTISEQAKLFLAEAGKWGRFIAIVGFIMVAFMVIFALFAGVFMSNLPGTEELPFSMGFFSIIYLVIAAVYFFPILYLYRFSMRIREALNRNDEMVLENAFENLKSHYKFLGILIIVMLVLYALIFALAIVGGLLSAF